MPGPRVSSASRGFTLLEVMLATLIVGTIAMTLFRFLGSNLTAIHVSKELGDERDALQSVIRLVEKQLRDLPVDEPKAILGQPFKFHGLSNDAITWRSGAGPGLMTTAAAGEFLVTLTVQPVGERSAETELGLRRRPWEPRQETNGAGLNRGGGDRRYNWLPLVRPMAALEIRYFDEQAGQWVDAWTEPDRRPNLVRLRLWRRAGDAPVEAVLPLPSSRLNL